MAEAETTESEVTQTKAEALSAKRAVSTVSTLAQLALGSFATFSGLLYAMGYLLTLGQMRMLGAGSIDVSNQEIVRQVVSIPLLSLACAAGALLTLEGLLVAGALLLVCLNTQRLGLFLQEHVAVQKLSELMVRWGGPLVALLIVSLFSTAYLSKKILSQRDLLIDGRNVSVDQSAKPRTQFLLHQYPIDDLSKLKASKNAGQQIYGFQVWAIVFCLTVLVGLWITLEHANQLSFFRLRIARLALGVASLLVLLQFLNIPFLYGYLVMDTKFPAIETRGFPTEKASDFRPQDGGNRLLLIGAKSGKYVVYSLEHQQMWRGVDEGDLLPAKQLPEQDPFVFENPLPTPAQTKSVSGGLVENAETETSQNPISTDHWIDLLSILLPAGRSDGLANTFEEDPGYYSAQWDEIGSLVITTHIDETFDLDLFEVHDRRGNKRDHFIAFKLSNRKDDGPDAESEAADQPGFIGRPYLRSGQQRALTPGRYYHCGAPYRIRQLLRRALSPKPAEDPAEADGNAEQAPPEKSEEVAAPDKPSEVKQAVVDAAKPPTESAEQNADAQPQPAATEQTGATEQSAAEEVKPAAETPPQSEQPSAEKTADQTAAPPSAKKTADEIAKPPSDAETVRPEDIKLKKK